MSIILIPDKALPNSLIAGKAMTVAMFPGKHSPHAGQIHSQKKSP